MWCFGRASRIPKDSLSFAEVAAGTGLEEVAGLHRCPEAAAKDAAAICGLCELLFVGFVGPIWLDIPISKYMTQTTTP